MYRSTWFITTAGRTLATYTTRLRYGIRFSDTPTRYLFRILVAVSDAETPLLLLLLTGLKHAFATEREREREREEKRGKRAKGKTGKGSCGLSVQRPRRESRGKYPPIKNSVGKLAYSGRLSTWGTEYARAS